MYIWRALYTYKKPCHIHTYIHTYKHTYIHPYIHTYIHTYKHTYIQTLITLHYITLHCIALHYINYITFTLHYITLHCIALHCIALHCMHVCMYAWSSAWVWVYLCILRLWFLLPHRRARTKPPGPNWPLAWQVSLRLQSTAVLFAHLIYDGGLCQTLDGLILSFGTWTDHRSVCFLEFERIIFEVPWCCFLTEHSVLTLELIQSKVWKWVRTDMDGPNPSVYSLTCFALQDALTPVFILHRCKVYASKV